MANILIVDDSSIARIKLKTILTKAGHTIISEAATGFQACREYEKHKPDIVTMDITMPMLDGISAIKKIIESFPDAKIVVVSALTQKHMILAALESGAKHYIIKPLEEIKVLSIINQVLEGEGALQTGNVNVEAPKPGGNSNSVPKATSSTFLIENKNGTYVISLSQKLNQHNLHAFSTAIQGILSSSMRTVFDFGNVDTLDDDVLDAIAAIIDYIIKLGGVVTLVSRNESFIEQATSKDGTIFSSFSPTIPAL